MKTSVIRHRVADFLRRYAPFDAITEDDLLDLAGSGRVKFHQSGEYLFRQGEPKAQLVWIIQQGRVELLDQRSPDEQLRDVLGEGDLLALERFVGDGSCLYSARTTTDVILYGVAAAVFDSLISRYPTAKRYLSAHFSVSGILGFGRTSWLDAEAPSMDFLRARLVTVSLNASLAEIAPPLIGAKNGVAALIDDGKRPVGIITPIDLCAANISSARVVAPRCPPTIAAPLSTRAVVREMLKAKTEELAITTDGTVDSPVEAILTASELALFCGHNPVRLISAIRHAGSAAEIVPLLHQASRLLLDALAQPLDVDDGGRIGTEVVSALANACIRLACAQVLAAGIDPPATPSCWVMFGVSARGELLRPELATIAAVYDDSNEAGKPEDSIYFAAVAGETLAWFHACGLVDAGLPWPEGSHAGMPLSEWRRFYCETIRSPLGHNLYARREFFDVLPISGDISILHKLHDEISIELRDHELAITLLANDTLAHLPPLTFFRGLVLELDGKQRDTFDISSAALTPISDAARVLAIAKRRLSPANTLERLAAAQLDFPEEAAIFREAAEAFRIALYYQALAGSSRINTATLGRFDQLLLKTAFSSIQRLLEFTTSTFIPTA
jgi:CBS domain-containing protein